MNEPGIEIKETLALKNPLLIAGFEGWGNALNVSNGMAAFLVRQLNARAFARLNPDLFYRYDKNRPSVDIKDGILKALSPPGGAFYIAEAGLAKRDILILKCDEPHLGWRRFIKDLFSLCHQLDIRFIITLGSMYDNVLHSDRILSAIASDTALLSRLKQWHVVPITYQGPSAIHSTIQGEAQKRGLDSMSLWCHCPYYLEGAVHYGLQAHLAKLLSAIGGFECDTSELEAEWHHLNRQIQALIDENQELQNMIAEIRKAKVRSSWVDMKGTVKNGEKVINLTDYILRR